MQTSTSISLTLLRQLRCGKENYATDYIKNFSRDIYADFKRWNKIMFN